jgi:hypothetical protein
MGGGVVMVLIPNVQISVTPIEKLGVTPQKLSTHLHTQEIGATLEGLKYPLGEGVNLPYPP